MSITLILIIITCAITVLAWKNSELAGKWILNPYLTFRNKQYYRVLTSGFLHSDTMHLAFNMFMLWMFGTQVESVFLYYYGTTGGILFVGVYLLAIVVSDLPTLFKFKDNPAYNSLGASGGTAAILFIYVMFTPVTELCLWALLCLPGFVWAAIYIGYSIYMSKRGKDNINHDAHLYGSLFGIGVAIVVFPKVLPAFINQISTYLF